MAAAGAIFGKNQMSSWLAVINTAPADVLVIPMTEDLTKAAETATFLRRTSLVKYSRAAIAREAEIIERFGNMESLAAHARAGMIRRGKREK